MSRVRPELLIVGAAVLWGTTGTAQDLGDVGASPVAVGTIRILLGGLLPYVWHTATADRIGAYLSPVAHMADLSRGVFDTRPAAFYAISTAWVLFATVRVLESRRWR